MIRTVFLISGEYKAECNNEIKVLVSKIKELKDVKKEKELLITSNKQCITNQKDLIKTTRKNSGEKYDSLTLLMEKNISFV